MSWIQLSRLEKFISRAWKRIGDYRFFRGLGQGVAESWEKSGKTVS